MQSPIQSIIDLLFGVRAQVAPRMVAGTRFVGLSVVALGGLLVAEGYTVVGSTVLVASVPVTWFTGVWVVPRSVDAYFVKISNIMNDSYTNLQYDSHRQRQQLSEIARELTGFDPPQSTLDLRQRILADIDRIENTLGDESASFSGRAIAILEPSQSLRYIRTGLDQDFGEPYVKMVAGALDRYRRYVDEGRERNQQSLRRLLARANKLRPPRSLAKRHEEYLKVLDEYVSSMNTYYVLAQDGEAEAVRKAAMIVEVAYANLKRESRKYIAELRLKARHNRTISSAK